MDGQRRAWSAAAIAVTVAFVAGAALRGLLPGGAPASEAPQPLARLTIALPTDAPAAAESGRPALALSPTGERLAYAARRGAATQLFVRPLDQIEAAPLPGTDGALEPFFSPDGDWIAFFAGGRLEKVNARGGEVVTVCDSPGAPGGGSWGADGTILFAAADAGLFRVAAEGGAPQPVNTRSVAGPGETILWPELLPGGRAVVLTVAPRGGPGRVAVLSLETGEGRSLADGIGYARYAPTGHLIIARARTLIGLPFDAVRLEVKGRPVAVLEGVLTDPATGAAQFALSRGGTLVYVPGESAPAERALLWVDRSGGTAPVVPQRRAFEQVAISPDGRRLAVSISEAGRLAIGIYEFDGAAFRGLSLEGSNGLPVWSPDGAHLAYVSVRAGAWSLFLAPTSGDGRPELLSMGEHPRSPSGFSPDGRRLAFTEVRPDTRGDIYLLPLEGDRTPEPIVSTAADEWGAVFSPGGRLLAYTSNESGRDEVYVRPFPGPGPARQVSADGGSAPVWSRRGGELFYRRGKALLSVSLSEGRGAAISAGPPRQLFEGEFAPPAFGSPGYDVAPDGRRFIMLRGGGQDAGAPGRLNVVLGWFEDLKRRVLIGQE
jgi:serine/threonine-protein kinase